MARKPPSVGVIGLGYVGKAVRSLLGRHFDLVCWDASSSDPYPHDDLEACEFALICVGTPSLPSGRADLRAVYDAVQRIPCRRIILKSTVVPGTTDDLARVTKKEICHWPEFISSSSYYNPFFGTDLLDVPFAVIGGREELRKLVIDKLLPVVGPTKRFFQCSATEAELIKYTSNAYFATKVVFANEMRRVVDVFQANWHTVREGWLLDPRVERMHTAVFSQEPGFSGTCLPKDTSAIIAASIDAGYYPALLAQVMASNHQMRLGRE